MPPAPAHTALGLARQAAPRPHLVGDDDGDAKLVRQLLQAAQEAAKRVLPRRQLAAAHVLCAV
jgi:hypothetical protein